MKHLRVFINYGNYLSDCYAVAKALRERLAPNYNIFKKILATSRTVVLTSYQTISQRHGSATFTSWLENQKKSVPLKRKTSMNVSQNLFTRLYDR